MTVPPATITRTAPAGPTPRAAGRRLSAMSTTAPESNSPSATPSMFKSSEQRRASSGFSMDPAVDAKTAVVMAIDTAMLGVLAALAPAPRDLPLPLAFDCTRHARSHRQPGLLRGRDLPADRGPQGIVIISVGSRPARPSHRRHHAHALSAGYLEDLLPQCHRNTEMRDTDSQASGEPCWLFGGIAVAGSALSSLASLKMALSESASGRPISVRGPASETLEGRTAPGPRWRRGRASSPGGVRRYGSGASRRRAWPALRWIGDRLHAAKATGPSHAVEHRRAAGGLVKPAKR